MDKIKIVLGSKSPRRQELVKELGFEVEVRTKEVDEIYPDSLALIDVPEFLAKLKSEPLKSDLKNNEVLLTSDTVVTQPDQSMLCTLYVYRFYLLSLSYDLHIHFPNQDRGH